MHTPAPWSTANTCSKSNCHVCKLHPTAEWVRAQYQLQKLQEKLSWNVRVIRRHSDKRQNCNPPMAAHTKRRKHKSHSKTNTRIAEVATNINTGKSWPRKRKNTKRQKQKLIKPRMYIATKRESSEIANGSKWKKQRDEAANSQSAKIAKCERWRGSYGATRPLIFFEREKCKND